MLMMIWYLAVNILLYSFSDNCVNLCTCVLLIVHLPAICWSCFVYVFL